MCNFFILNSISQKYFFFSHVWGKSGDRVREQRPDFCKIGTQVAFESHFDMNVAIVFGNGRFINCQILFSKVRVV